MRKYLEPVWAKQLFLVGIVLLIVALQYSPVIFKEKQVTHEEVGVLSKVQWKFPEYATYFENLAKVKGGKYAFDILAEATFPQGIDMHLLGHVIGDVLYKQKGLDGMQVCTQEFRNACSHSIVVGYFTERGVGSLSDIVDVCKKAPGGKGAYTICFHGLGHGVLAYHLYDLEQAVSLCKKIEASIPLGREFQECVGGVIMEMFAGFHDRASWERERASYFKEDDPLYPCSAEFIPDIAKPMCYSYMTPHFFKVAGMNLSSLEPDLFPEALKVCESISKKEWLSRDYCFGGFGKEFVGVANGQDIRTVGTMGHEKVALIGTWCDEAREPEDSESCRMGALKSFFWGGESIPDAAFTFCEQANGKMQNSCYAELTSMIVYFHKNTAAAFSLCNRLPELHKQYCHDQS